MNCFQLVKTVLDDLYGEVWREYRDNTDAVINSKLTDFTNEYDNLENVKFGGINYSDPAAHFAYVYCYTAAHANIVFRCIEDLKILKDVFNAEKLTVGCLGGGPGSDILGILKFLDCYNEVSSKLMNLKFITLDKEPGWKEIWHNIDNKITTSFSSSPPNNFLEVDITKGTSIDAEILWNIDVFTMIYFVSEICGDQEGTHRFFERLFNKVKPGMLLLFVDNHRWTFYNWFDEVARANGLETLKKGSYLPFQIAVDEKKEDLGCYYNMFNYDPKLKAKIVYRVYRKKEDRPITKSSHSLREAVSYDDDIPF